MHRTPKIHAVGLALLAGLAFAPAPMVLAQTAAGSVHAAAKRADFRGEAVSVGVQHLASWAIHTGDHKGLPFIVVDKVNAKAAAFDGGGKLIRATPILLGLGVGDSFPPGVMAMNMYETKPGQRITPAGRFFAEEERDVKGQRVLWVDYDAGIALHKLPTKKTQQRRHERILSADPAEHRITYGCINVSPVFYDQVVHPYFRGKGGMVYVLPETKPVQAVFNSYDVGGV